jgi:hypothetical protein
MTLRIHVHACLAGKEKNYQHDKKHHVSCQTKEDEKSNAVEQFARTTVLSPPIVIATTASATRGTPVDWGFAADSRLFPFRFRRGVRKNRGHGKPRQE